MAYCARDDLFGLVPEKKVRDWSNPMETLDPAGELTAIDQVIDFAASEVDGFLSAGGYSVPLDKEYPIYEVNPGAYTFKIRGLHGDQLVPGSTLVVTGSTANDNTYLVYAVEELDSETTITVVEVIPSSVADGNLKSPAPEFLKLINAYLALCILIHKKGYDEKTADKGIIGKCDGYRSFLEDVAARKKVLPSAAGEVPPKPPGLLKSVPLVRS